MSKKAVRIVSLNLNGIRSAERKGFFPWLARLGADVVCLQELKAQDADLTELMRNPGGLFGAFHPAERKGYSGVGLYARRAPDTLIHGLGIPDIQAEHSPEQIAKNMQAIHAGGGLAFGAAAGFSSRADGAGRCRSQSS